MKLWIVILFCCALLCLYVGYKCGQQARRFVPKEVIVEVPMSISDIQRFLADEGHYQGRIDGIWGPKMERAWCDYCAVKSIERMAGEPK
jgi:hypothetical protein